MLTVPANKTNAGYSKPVHRAMGDAIHECEAVRSSLPQCVDAKTGRRVNYLLMDRGRQLGVNFINLTLIPILCEKAGVPLSDAKGNITSHRARSTIASQLYNAPEPMSLDALKEWLGHGSAESTKWYAALGHTRLAREYLSAEYFERNVAVVNVLLDRDAIVSGAAARGEPYKYVHLGHGYCSNPYWAKCAHRMVCQRCEFYVPLDSARVAALEASEHNLRLLEQIPITESEKRALEADLDTLNRLSGSGLAQ
jgi:hypothetical protein